MKRQLFAFACATLFGCSIAHCWRIAVLSGGRLRSRRLPAPVFLLGTGLDVGAHVGTGWGTTELEIDSISGLGGARGGFVIPVSQTQCNGFLGGVQGGYNWQLGPCGR